MAGELGEQFGVDRTEQALDLAAPLWSGDRREDELEPEVRGNLFEMRAGEVRAVVDVEHVRDAAYDPCRIVLAPDRLAKRERSLQGGRGADKHRVAGDRPRVVVQNDCQPWTHDLAACVEHMDVEFGVVALPDRVGSFGAVAMNHLVAIAVGRRSLVGERDHCRIERADEGVDRTRRGHGPIAFLGKRCDAASDRRERRTRLPERHPLDRRNKFRIDPALSHVRSDRTRQPDQSVRPVAREPALRGAKRYAPLARADCQRHLVLDVGTQHREPRHRLAALGVGQFGQTVSVPVELLGDGRSRIRRGIGQQNVGLLAWHHRRPVLVANAGPRR